MNWGVPTTLDPNTSVKFLRYKWELYRDTNGGVPTAFCQEDGVLCKSIAIEMEGVSRHLSKGQAALFRKPRIPLNCTACLPRGVPSGF